MVMSRVTSISQKVREKIAPNAEQQLACRLELIVELFIALTRPTRRQIRAYLRAQESQARVQLTRITSEAIKRNYLARGINEVQGFVNELAIPLDNLLQTVPLENLTKLPAFNCVFRPLFNSTPVKIPPAMAALMENVVGEDFFDGIESYRDLKRKINLFLLRAKKISAASTYANRFELRLRKLLDTISIYLNIIETLDTEGT